MMLFFFFFFQAEDGIRDIGVTGVQTCALPIYFISYLKLNILGRATNLSVVLSNSHVLPSVNKVTYLPTYLLTLKILFVQRFLIG